MTKQVTPATDSNPNLDTSRGRYVQSLVKEAKGLLPGVERFAAIVYEIHDSRAYRELGYASFEEFMLGEFGRSLSTGNRWVKQGRELVVGTADGSVPRESAGQRMPGSEGPPPRISQNEAEKRQAARRRGEDPGPVPTDAERAAETVRRETAKRQATPDAITGASPADAATATTIPIEAPSRPVERLRPSDQPDVVRDRIRAAAKLLLKQPTADIGAALADADIGRLVAHLGQSRRRLARTEPERRSPKDCPHPPGRRIGDFCAQCEATLTKKRA